MLQGVSVSKEIPTVGVIGIRMTDKLRGIIRGALLCEDIAVGVIGPPCFSSKTGGVRHFRERIACGADA